MDLDHPLRHLYVIGSEREISVFAHAVLQLWGKHSRCLIVRSSYTFHRSKQVYLSTYPRPCSMYERMPSQVTDDLASRHKKEYDDEADGVHGR